MCCGPGRGRTGRKACGSSVHETDDAPRADPQLFGGLDARPPTPPHLHHRLARGIGLATARLFVPVRGDSEPADHEACPRPEPSATMTYSFRQEGLLRLPPLQRENRVQESIPLPIPPARNGLDVQVAIQRGQVADFTRPLRVETPISRLHTVEAEGSIPSTPTAQSRESSRVRGFSFFGDG